MPRIGQNHSNGKCKYALSLCFDQWLQVQSSQIKQNKFFIHYYNLSPLKRGKTEDSAKLRCEERVWLRCTCRIV